MSGPALDPALRAFIAQHIDAIDTLEVFLLLARDPQQGWTVDEIGAELRTSSFAAAQRLGTLTATGLVSTERESRHRLNLDDEVAAALARRLADAYRDRRTSVIAAIYAPAQPDAALLSFATAFHLDRDRSGRK